MKRIVWTLALSLALASVFGCSNPASNAPRALVTNESSPAPSVDAGKAEVLQITPANSQIKFVGSKVTGIEPGSFQKFDGTVQLVDGKSEQSRVTINIDMSSVTTDSEGLAEHLRTPDFFDVKKFPNASFVSSEIKPGGEKGATHTVTGVLELHGVKKAITFPATITVKPEGVSVESEFAINRKDFGITFAGRTNDLIRDDVVLKLSVHAPRKAG